MDMVVTRTRRFAGARERGKDPWWSVPYRDFLIHPTQPGVRLSDWLPVASTQNNFGTAFFLPAR